MEWVNAKYEAPIMFGKYFVKINGIKQIIDFHEFDFYLNRGEEVLWLKEDSMKRSDMHTTQRDSTDYIRVKVGQHLELTHKDTYLVQKQNQEIRALKEKIAKYQLYLKMHVGSCIPVEIISEKLSILKKETTLHKKFSYPTKEEVKLFLNKYFRVSYIGFTLKNVKRLFPQLKNEINIPENLKKELIDVYTEEGMKLIEFKLKRSVSASKAQKKRKEEDRDLENQLDSVKESDLKNHFKETMKYVGIEFELIEYSAFNKSPKRCS